MLKKCKIIIPFLYLMIVIFNAAGFDDKNFILFFASPPAWLLEGASSLIPIYVISLITFI